MTDEPTLDELRRQFASDMHRGIRELSQLGYDARFFQRMLVDHPADEAARRLVLDRIPSYGLWRLKELNKLDMNVEMWVLLPWYERLFNPDIRQKAADKLRLLNVNV